MNTILERAKVVGTLERKVLRKCYLPNRQSSWDEDISEDEAYSVCEDLCSVGLLGRRDSEKSTFFWVTAKGKKLLLSDKPAIFNWREFPYG